MNNAIKKILLTTLIATMLIAPSMTLLQAYAITTTPNWDVSGPWTFENTSTKFPSETPYVKTMAISQDANGHFIGSGNNVPPGFYWNVEGDVVGDAITFKLTYKTEPLVGYVATFVGEIKTSGEIKGQMLGTWSDTQFGDSGYWHTTSGLAKQIVAVTFPQGSGVQSVDVIPFVFPIVLPGANGPTYDITAFLGTGQKYVGHATITIHYDPGLLSETDQLKLHIAQFDFLLGDVNHDGKVNLTDLLIIGKALCSTPTSKNWNPIADLNGDLKVDLKDLCLATKNFGKTAQWINLPTTIDIGAHTATADAIIDSGFGVH